jgi:tetratricopeptide (TPR) repeat protein
LAALGIVLAIGGAVAAVALARARHVAPPPPTAPPVPSNTVGDADAGFPDFGATLSKNAEATESYRSAMRAYRDADNFAAMRALDRAIALDPDFAAARLRRALIKIPMGPGERDHARAAQRLRAQLGKHDQVLVEVVAALADEPARFDAALEMLERASRAAADADFVLHACRLQLRLYDERARAICARAAELDPDAAMPVQKLATAKMNTGDALGGIESFNECLRLSSLAVACLEPLWRLYSFEGRCSDALETARRLVSTDQDVPYYYDLLAQSLFAVGEPSESVKLALASKETHFGPAEASIGPARDGAFLSLAMGDFEQAAVRLGEWDRAVQSSGLEAAHFPVAVLRIELAEERGRSAEAIAIAREHLQRRPAWTLATEYDYSMYFLGKLHALGGLPNAEFTARREEWLARISPRSPYRAWMDAFAIPAASPADARIALDGSRSVAPERGALEARPEWEEALGRVDLMAGRPAEAVAHLARAANACTVLNEPFGQTRASLELGLAYEDLGRKEEACSAYQRVLQRWGGARGSVTARSARQRRRVLECP